MEKLNISLVELNRTCIACPSQWDAYSEAGDYYYIRYRHGWLSVNKNAVLENPVFGGEFGDDLDGYMTDAEMLELTGFTVSDELKVTLDKYPWMEENIEDSYFS